MSDPRSYASEQFVFEMMGITKAHVVIEEDEMILLLASLGLQGVKVPERIYRNPKNKHEIWSLEVKRVPGNRLPVDHLKDGTLHQRLIRNRHKAPIWPWARTVQSALHKANTTIVEMFGVKNHCIVFLFPQSLDNRARRRLIQQIHRFFCFAHYSFVVVLFGDSRLLSLRENVDLLI